MKNSAPSSLGILAIAAIFGLVALIIAYALLDFAGMVSFVIGLIVAIITAIVLWMGWGDADASAYDQRDTPSSAFTSKSATDAAPSKPVSVAKTTAPSVATSAAPTAGVSTEAHEPKVEPAQKVEESAAKADETVTAKVSEPVETPPVAEPAPVSATVEPVAKDEPADKETSSDKSEGESEAVAAPEAKPKAAKAAPKRAPVAADGKPELLSEARGGQGDDLKQIKGVGPKMETMLNTMGVWHFDQIAGWRKKEVEWVDNNLEGFKGRVSRDEWVKQAKVLAKGGTTEFSKKVKKGGVY